MENEGRFPARKPLSRNSCAWLLSDLLHWVRNPPTVENIIIRIAVNLPIKKYPYGKINCLGW
ncbi:hypothetical protein XNC1_3925 [Xenorhabdus nematophila ATCC 19061]|uniref:AlpA family phage regulatory protein n=1 Tax=Xenorhabdus nematophila (strain ATCC 19061 / DSM 3370 / CCUG 14189 / LMG 1036 / NCIMB 9965 / AN6) TaxID=406817 RepID=D3VBW4_XENNA|nr:hypothetical protein XNC1_3925 [Xenorhabdus nematophila ATCC 19061]